MIYRYLEFINEEMDFSDITKHNEEDIDDIFLALKEDGYIVKYCRCYFTNSNKPFYNKNNITSSTKYGWCVDLKKKFKINSTFKNNTDIIYNLDSINDIIKEINRYSKKLNILGYDVNKSISNTTSTVNFTLHLIEKEGKKLDDADLLINKLKNKFTGTAIGRSGGHLDGVYKYDCDSYKKVGDEIHVRYNNYSSNFNFYDISIVNDYWRSLHYRLDIYLRKSIFRNKFILDSEIKMPETSSKRLNDEDKAKYLMIIRKK